MKKILFLFSLLCFAFAGNSQTRIKLAQLERCATGMTCLVLTDSLTGKQKYIDIDSLGDYIDLGGAAIDTDTRLSNFTRLNDSTLTVNIIDANGTVTGTEQVDLSFLKDYIVGPTLQKLTTADGRDSIIITQPDGTIETFVDKSLAEMIAAVPDGTSSITDCPNDYIIVYNNGVATKVLKSALHLFTVQGTNTTGSGIAQMTACDTFKIFSTDANISISVSQGSGLIDISTIYNEYTPTVTLSDPTNPVTSLAEISAVSGGYEPGALITVGNYTARKQTDGSLVAIKAPATVSVVGNVLTIDGVAVTFDPNPTDDVITGNVIRNDSIFIVEDGKETFSGLIPSNATVITSPDNTIKITAVAGGYEVQVPKDTIKNWFNECLTVEKLVTADGRDSVEFTLDIGGTLVTYTWTDTDTTLDLEKSNTAQGLDSVIVKLEDGTVLFGFKDTDTWTDVVNNGDGTSTVTDPEGDAAVIPTPCALPAKADSVVYTVTDTVTYSFVVDYASCSYQVFRDHKSVQKSDNFIELPADEPVSGLPTTSDISTYVSSRPFYWGTTIYYIGAGTAEDPEGSWLVDDDGSVISNYIQNIDQNCELVTNGTYPSYNWKSNDTVYHVASDCSLTYYIDCEIITYTTTEEYYFKTQWQSLSNFPISTEAFSSYYTPVYQDEIDATVSGNQITITDFSGGARTQNFQGNGIIGVIAKKVDVGYMSITPASEAVSYVWNASDYAARWASSGQIYVFDRSGVNMFIAGSSLTDGDSIYFEIDIPNVYLVQNGNRIHTYSQIASTTLDSISCDRFHDPLTLEQSAIDAGLGLNGQKLSYNPIISNGNIGSTDLSNPPNANRTFNTNGGSFSIYDTSSTNVTKGLVGIGLGFNTNLPLAPLHVRKANTGTVGLTEAHFSDTRPLIILESTDDGKYPGIQYMIKEGNCGHIEIGVVKSDGSIDTRRAEFTYNDASTSAEGEGWFLRADYTGIKANGTRSPIVMGIERYGNFVLPRHGLGLFPMTNPSTTSLLGISGGKGVDIEFDDAIDAAIAKRLFANNAAAASLLSIGKFYYDTTAEKLTRVQ